MTHYIGYPPDPGNDFPAYIGLPLFDFAAAHRPPRNPLHVVADRLSRQLGIPFRVALAHAEAAGLGGRY